MDNINIYKITFDYDDGPNAWSDAIEHVTASSEDKAKDALERYIKNTYGETARILEFHSIRKLDITDGMVLENENHYPED